MNAVPERTSDKILILESIGYLMLFSVCMIVSIGTLGLVFGGRIHPYMLLVSLCLSAVLFYYLFRDKIKLRTMASAAVMCLAVIMLVMLACGLTYTVDYDGNAYHKMAAGYLKNGWNPLKESADTFADAFFHDEGMPETGIWLDHYGKSTWIFAAIIYAVTGNIECGKMYHLLGILMGICLWYPYLRRKQLGNLKSWILTLVIILNPVSIAQLLTYYVDGFLFSMLYILVLGLIQLADEQEQIKSCAWSLIFSSMSVLSNVKFTGLLYGGVYCVGFFVLYVFKNGKKTGIKDCVKAFQRFFLLAVLCTGVIGFPVYIKNYLDHGTPTYPLTGSGSIDIITSNSPSGFDGKNRFFKLFYSLFGKLDNILYSSEKEMPVLKIPFSLHKDELGTLSCDMRISGFGLFFSGLFLISLIMITGYMRKEKNSSPEKTVLLVLTVLSVLLTFAVQETWWARYAPYFYAVIPISVWMILKNSREDKHRIARRNLAACYLLLLAWNNLYFGLVPVHMISESAVIHREFQQIEGKIWIVFPDVNLQGQRFNLIDHGIEYGVADSFGENESRLYQMYYTQDK